MKTYEKASTIAAIATAPGDGGIGIIRISGPHAIAVAKKIFSKPIETFKSHTLHFGQIVSDKKELIDEGLITVMRGPKSYTGEDTVELYCHGGSLITKRVLEAAIEAGARAALPGEFTYKAFMNGRLDLSQAEAVQALIGAKNDQALKIAKGHLEGRLSEKVKSFQTRLSHLAAILEAFVDFPEEGLEFVSKEKFLATLSEIINEIKQLVNTFHHGKVAFEGVTLCLAGPPNVGKSSLMNALLGKDRAIVTPIPGTTRDLLEDNFHLGTLHLKLIDTAGIRDSSEVIEQEGIRRTKKAVDAADFILLVLDPRENILPLQPWVETLPVEKTLLVWNKIDLPHPEKLPKLNFESVQISALNGFGIEELKSSMEKLIYKGGLPSKDEIVIGNVRHKAALTSAYDALLSLQSGLSDEISPEFLTSEMRRALTELGTIIGRDVTEDILSSIFSTFCIGK